MFLFICWKYTEIFYSLELSLFERIKNASCVVNFLRIWRNFVCVTKELKLKENFLTAETYQDIQLSCHHVVLFIKACRDFAPNYPVYFERLGTDGCEEYFLANSSFIVNKHNYTISDMY